MNITVNLAQLILHQLFASDLGLEHAELGLRNIFHSQEE